MLDALIMVLLLATSVFLILLVLVQRGRGGGLAGAFGGMGGQSAFGTKAGDLFTRITIFTAAFWIILCAFSVKYFSEGNRSIIAPGIGKSAETAPDVNDANRQPQGTSAPSTAPPTGGAAATPAAATDETSAPDSGATKSDEAAAGAATEAPAEAGAPDKAK